MLAQVSVQAGSTVKVPGARSSPILKVPKKARRLQDQTACIVNCDQPDFFSLCPRILKRGMVMTLRVEDEKEPDARDKFVPPLRIAFIVASFTSKSCQPLSLWRQDKAARYERTEPAFSFILQMQKTAKSLRTLFFSGQLCLLPVADSNFTSIFHPALYFAQVPDDRLACISLALSILRRGWESLSARPTSTMN